MNIFIEWKLFSNCGSRYFF